MADQETIEAEDDVTVVVPPAEEPKAPEAESKPPEAEKGQERPEKAKAPVEDLAEQFKAAQAGQAAEKARREAVERQIHEERQAAGRLAQERDAYRQGMGVREAEVIQAGISAAENERAAAKVAFKNAFDAGDSDAMADAQARMADASTRKMRFDEAKYELESRYEQEQRQPAQQPQPQRPAQPADPFEGYLAQFTEPTAKWLREHREWADDGQKNARLQSAHYDAVANGIKPDSDEYFAHVEQHIGLTEAPAKTNGAAKPAARRGPPPGPPASGARGGGAVGGNEVRLSRTEAAAATDGTHVWQSHDLKAGRIKDKSQVGQPIGHQEFARRKLEMTKAGAYDRSYLEQ